MPEREFQVEQYGVEYVCDSCKSGTMRPKPDSPMFLTSPLRFTHQCGECGAEQDLTDRYPTVRFRWFTKTAEKGQTP